MTTYAIQVTNKNAPGDTGQAIVGTPEWAEQNLGGDWVEMPDPYTPDPDDPRVYAGPGMKYDPGVVEKFCSDEWTVEKGTQMQSDGDGGFFWFYNTQGQLTWYNGKIWRNLSTTGTPNVWTPGVAGWREYPLDGGIPVWVQPVGAIDAYPKGAFVKHNGGSWASEVAANVWEPGAVGSENLWTLIDGEVVDPEPVIAPWQTWSGLNEDLYQIGDQVTHNGQTWEATAGNNHWEPGVFGWVTV